MSFKKYVIHCPACPLLCGENQCTRFPAFALPCLMMALALPAQADGGWRLHAEIVTPPTVTTETLFVGKYKTSTKAVAWTTPPDATNTLTLPSCASDVLRGIDFQGLASSGSVNLTFSVKFTGTWQGTDPAPPSVKVIESAAASADATYTPTGLVAPQKAVVSASVNDGLESAPAGSLIEVTRNETRMVAATPTPDTTPPAHLTTFTGSSWSFTRSFAVSVSVTLNSTSNYLLHRDYTCQAILNNYTVSVHAQPYNFRRTYYSDQNPPVSVVSSAGELQFHYNWNSTSGNKADLNGIEIHESVDASASPTSVIKGEVCYLPPLPFNYGPPLHFDKAYVLGSSIQGISDDHSWGDGVALLADCFVKPYTASSFDLTQNYTFYDPATMLAGGREFIPGTASGPWTINNAVVADTQSPSGYSFVVSKSGVTSLPVNLPN